MIKHFAFTSFLALSISFGNASATSYSDFYFFGDSLTDVGNNSCQTNRDANSGQCMTWANDLYTAAFHTNIKPSNQGGTDYAVSGSVSNDALNQVNQYLSTHQNQADPNAYYFMLTGGNDVMNLALNASADVKAKIDHLEPFQALGNIASTIGRFNYNLEGQDGSAGIITHEISAIKALENAGAKHIMVIDLPNISIAPTVQNASNAIIASCQKSILVPSHDKPICLSIGQSIDEMGEIFIRDYNDVLTRNVRNLLDPTIVKTFSMFDLTQNMIKNNVLNPNGVCSQNAQDCGKYLFYNGVHPSAAAHLIMANKIAQAL
ncbi:MAG: lipase/esterase [Gammaproteobacteria bacterium]|jgi:outer membrane lipase/esterase|nr:lipase/esterase [Gammaproteobacteria bacterium]